MSEYVDSIDNGLRSSELMRVNSGWARPLTPDPAVPPTVTKRRSGMLL